MARLLRRRDILHRGAAATLGVLLLLTPGLGQRRRHDLPIPETPTKKVKGPRALALVEWPAPTAGATAASSAVLGPRPRLIPVAILVEGHYYDASIYKASPVPMALDPGTVYEVEQSGESVGLVTLETPRVLGQTWWADARFQSAEALKRANARRAERDRPAPTPAEGPPRLRRSPGSSSSGSSQNSPSAAPAQTTASRDDDDRPVLRRKETDADSAPPAEVSDAQAKPAAAAAAAPATPAAQQPVQSDDSARPVLRRGGTGKEQAEALPGSVDVNARPQSATAAKPGPAGTAAKQGTTSSSPLAALARPRVLVAISDEGGPEPRSFVYTWEAPRQQQLTAAMQKLAVAALQEYARAHPGERPGPLEDVQVRAFDLAFNNEPDLVLMASAHQLQAPTPTPRRPVTKGAKPAPEAAPPPPAAPADLTYWVTVVAREDYNGELRRQKVAVTDSKHLDAFSRLELIDAVDADGGGRGELLFREVSDLSSNFVLYRVAPDQLVQLYNSAQLER